MGVDGQRHAPSAFTPGKDPVPILQRAGWAPGPVWIGAENLSHTGIRSPDRPARSEFLYQLRYPALCALRSNVIYFHTCTLHLTLCSTVTNKCINALNLCEIS